MENKDLKLFTKLFKINIPYYEEYLYYLDLLSKSYYFDDVLQLFRDFEASVNYCKDVLGSDLSSESVKLSKDIERYIKSSEAYSLMMSKEFPKIPTSYSKIDTRKHENTDGFVFISIDIVKANFTSLKLFDPNNLLEDSWESLIRNRSDTEISDLFTKSKTFRQSTFGKLNPKRQQAFQKLIMSQHAYPLFLTCMDFCKIPYEVVFRSHDEFIIKVPSNLYEDSLINVLPKEVTVYGRQVPLKVSSYVTTPIGEGMELRTVVFDDKLTSGDQYLFRVPSDVFFLYYKLLILKEPLKGLDKMFMHNGCLCKYQEVPQNLTNFLNNLRFDA